MSYLKNIICLPFYVLTSEESPRTLTISQISFPLLTLNFQALFSQKHTYTNLIRNYLPFPNLTDQKREEVVSQFLLKKSLKAKEIISVINEVIQLLGLTFQDGNKKGNNILGIYRPPQG